MNFAKLTLPLVCLLLSTEVFAKRILFASQFSLIPENQAHVSFGPAHDWAFNPNSIKVMVWNIKKGQEKGLDKDLAYYGKDRDLFLFSEGYLSPPMMSIFNSFGKFRWDMGVAFLYKKDNNTKTGTMIGSKVEPSWTSVRHTKDYEPFIKTPKALMMAKYPVAGTEKDLLVISVHAINIVVPNAFERHMEIAKAEILKHDGPVIFAGDFNTNLPAKTKYLKQLTTNLGMQNVDFKNDKRMKVMGQYIDFVFTKGLYPKSAEVFGHLKSSDHKPMYLELALAP